MYPTGQTTMRDETLENLLKPACFMTRCYQQAFHYFFVIINIFIEKEIPFLVHKTEY
jgi:hypothetical protein